MTFDTAWEIFSKVIWPLTMIYAAYLHRELSAMATKIDNITRLIFDNKAEALKTFVTQDTVSTLETKLSRMLERIDDKVTRILEDRK